MILDTSAMVAILYREPEAADFARLIQGAEVCRISVANYVELSMVIESSSAQRVCAKRRSFFAALVS